MRPSHRAAAGPRIAVIAVLAAAMVGSAGWEADAAAPRRHVVEIRGFAYHPATVVAAPGDTIVWINRDMAPHTATATGHWDSGAIDSGESWRRVVTETDAGGYVCAFHPAMRGRLRVERTVATPTGRRQE